MLNTAIHYLYRDASNYKVHTEVVLKGEITAEQIKEVCDCLHDGCYFVPSAVGLPENRFEDWTEDDGPFFELYDSDFSLTERPATESMTISQMVEQFKIGKN